MTSDGLSDEAVMPTGIESSAISVISLSVSVRARAASLISMASFWELSDISTLYKGEALLIFTMLLYISRSSLRL